MELRLSQNLKEIFDLFLPAACLLCEQRLPPRKPESASAMTAWPGGRRSARPAVGVAPIPIRKPHRIISARPVCKTHRNFLPSTLWAGIRAAFARPFGTSNTRTG
jgi:hypothetical protein